MTCTHGPDDPVEQVRRRQTPGDVMNQDDYVVVAKRRQSRLDRSRPIRPSSHHIHAWAVSIHARPVSIHARPVSIHARLVSIHAGLDSILPGVAGDGPALIEVGAGCDDDHVCHVATTKNAPKCVSH
jgi:hypothetical protein